jgi:hypothetical protein
MADTSTATAPAGIPYGVARQKHADYTANVDVWSELSDLYKGGYALAAHASRYLPRLVGETQERYDDRIKAAGYVNYLGQIIDYFVSALFSHDLNVTEPADASDPTTVGASGDQSFWSIFAANADRRGTSIVDVLKSVFRSALLKQRSYIGADLPRPVDTTAPQNARDEQKSGLTRGYLYEIPVEQITNWKLEEATGAFSWCIINRCDQPQPSPFVAVGKIVETFKIWTRDDSGAVRWDLFAIQYEPEKLPKPEDVVAWTDGGVTTFATIPIQTLELSDAFWVGNKIGPLAKEHFQRRSTLVSSENKNLCAIPVYQAGPEVPAVGGSISLNSEDPERGNDFTTRAQQKGYVVVGANDKIYYAEPSGSCYELVDKQIVALKDEMFRVVHQMAASVSNNSTSLGRSGMSKKQDRLAEAIVLGEFGRIVRDFAKRIYDTVTAMRGESIVWVTSGLDAYDGEDRETLIVEAAQLDLVSIPSRTFKVEYKSSIAEKLLPTLNPQTKKVIRKEIEDGVDNEQDMKSIMDDARKDAVLNPTPDPDDGGGTDAGTDDATDTEAA